MEALYQIVRLRKHDFSLQEEMELKTEQVMTKTKDLLIDLELDESRKRLRSYGGGEDNNLQGM